MKGPRKQYEPISQLPRNALSVKNYALKEGIEVATAYGRFDAQKINIVDFQGYNFVVPIKKPGRKS